MAHLAKILFWFLAIPTLLQGCTLVGVYSVKMLSHNGGVVTPRLEPLPLVAGVRMDVDGNGEVETESTDSSDERFVLGSLTAELSAANVFRQVTYPTSGGENIMFAVSTWGKRHGPLDSPWIIAHVVACAGTLLILCPPVSSTYEYNMTVRIMKLPQNEEIAWYFAGGKSRVRYGIFSLGDDKGWQTAMTSALNELMTQIRMDEAGLFLATSP